MNTGICNICSYVPLDNTYNHTRSHATFAQQQAYFNQYVLHRLTDLSFTRFNKIKVNVNWEKLQECNYLYFCNEPKGKWFYAFITNITYLGEHSTLIEYELDVMQTYMFDYKLKECYIEREHVESDELGEHTIIENLETGEYIATAVNNIVNNTGSYCVATLSEWFFEELVGTPLVGRVKVGGAKSYTYMNWKIQEYSDTKIGGIPKTMYYVILSLTDVDTNLQGFIYWLNDIGKIDSLNTIYLAPKRFTNDLALIDPLISDELYREEIALPKCTTVFEPKNNKCKTYPYTFITVTANGQTSELMYEQFKDFENPTGFISSTFSADMQPLLTPYNYCGMEKNYNYSISSPPPTMLEWIKDSYQNYLAQTKNSRVIGLVTSIASIGVGLNPTVQPVTSHFLSSSAVARNPLLERNEQNTRGYSLTYNTEVPTSKALAIGGVGGVLGIVSSMADHKALPNSVGGNSSSNVMQALNEEGFYIQCNSLKSEYLTMVDSFFTMYGYKTNRVGTPNITSRPSFNYIKTGQCNLIGCIPYDITQIIISIYNKGITFWHTDDVCNYSLDNQI